MKKVIVIPARMKSSRLPGKPLIAIYGKALVQHVFDRCASIWDSSLIYVATEDKVIEDYCAKHGINCVNTGPAHTAIDRLKLFSDQVEADYYVNVQGDEPIIDQEDVLNLINYTGTQTDAVIIGKKAATEEEFYDFSKAKVVCDLNNRLLYSSRAGIPVTKTGKFQTAQRAIWIYSFTKKHLDLYHAAANEVLLEPIEDNEVIRFLEIGVPVYCIDMKGDSWAIDEEKDLKIVEEKLNLNK